MESQVLTAIKQALEESIAVKQSVLNDENLIACIAGVAQSCITAFRRGNKIILAGNGGSAADAQHIAAEFVSRFQFDRPGLPALAITTDTSMLTAIGNDYGYERLFARQLEANGRAGDIFVGISTSGNSKNILAALQACRTMNIAPFGLSGAAGRIGEFCDTCIRIPSISTPRIQEAHITVGHIICGLVEAAMFEPKNS
jgi:D-sedoheptulose 7-phosphate isomerase